MVVNIGMMMWAGLGWAGLLRRSVNKGLSVNKKKVLRVRSVLQQLAMMLLASLVFVCWFLCLLDGDGFE